MKILLKPLSLLKIVVCILCFSPALKAQQTPINSFYQMNWQTINPATIDRAYYLHDGIPMAIFTASYRQQWIGFEGAPSNSFISAEFLPERQDVYSAVDKFTKFGFSLLNDRFGAFTNWGVYGNYSYGFNVGNGQYLHFGLSPGLIRSQINPLKIDPLSKTTDNLLADYQSRSKLYFDLSMGVFYRHIEDKDRQFFCGLSVPQSLAVGLEKDSLHSSFSPNNRFRHLNFLAGMFINPTAQEMHGVLLEPSVLVKYAPLSSGSALIPKLPITIDVNFRAYFELNKFVEKSKQSFWIGTGYSTNSNFNVELGVIKSLDEDPRFGKAARFVRIGLMYSVPLGNRLVNFGQTIEANAAFSLE